MYALRAGLSHCVIDEDVVFLDAREDRYFALTGRAAKTFRPLVEALRSGAAVAASDARTFVACGILVEQATATDWQPPIERAQREWASSERGSAKLSTMGHGLIACGCILAALARIRTRSFEVAIQSGRRAHPERTPAPLASHVIDPFLTARRALPWRLDCLPQSLALRSYLRIHSVAADLVIGVSIRPFAAHCWLQIGDMVIGDTLERIGPFTPIRRVP